MGKLKNRWSKHNYAILCLWLMQKILCLWYPMTYSWYQWYKWYLFNLPRKNLPLHQVLDHRSSSYVGDLAAVVHKTQRQRVQTLRFVADNVRNSTFCWRGVDGTLFGRFFCWVSLLFRCSEVWHVWDVWGGNGLLQIGKFTGAIPAMRISELWIHFSANWGFAPRCTTIHLPSTWSCEKSGYWCCWILLQNRCLHCFFCWGKNREETWEYSGDNILE